MQRHHNSNGLNDPSLLQSSSSIALLQERFQQLQRNKEIRKERELLRLFATQLPQPSPCQNQPSKWLYHHDLAHPSRPLEAPNSALGPRSHLQTQHTTTTSSSIDLHGCETSLSIGLWPGRSNMRMQSPKLVCNNMEVDTSLHL